MISPIRDIILSLMVQGALRADHIR